MILGYVRVSTDDQNLDYQIKSLINAGVEERNIYKEKASASFSKQPELKKILEYLKSGDTLVIEALDRIGRDTLELLTLLKFFSDNKIVFHITSLNFKSDDPYNSDTLHFLSSVANIERKNLKRRTKKALDVLNSSNIKRGPKPLLTDFQKKLIDDLYDKGETVVNITKNLGLKTRTCVYKYLRERNKKDLTVIYKE